ncbi:MAG: SGNH/GDSL hydrolase family protein [Anaerolineae bacterium]|nr:SGNH/GDSL hydrolase family protein [Anaerolineae bacterium]
MKIDPHSRLVMIGDSITDCGRARPVGEATGDALGSGYVALVNALLNSTCPEACIRITNVGISGNTVRDLERRWESDVLDLAPDWLSIMIGINDVWRHFDSRLLTERHVGYDEYAATLETLVRGTLPRLKGMVLMTPYMIEPNRSEPMRAMMDRYSDCVRDLATKYRTVLVDTQAAFDDVVAHVHPMALAGDRVHPNLTGHMVIARAFLRAIEYAW